VVTLLILQAVGFAVAWVASFGTITPSGLFTAAQGAGTGRVIASGKGAGDKTAKADTSTVTIASPPVSPGTSGRGLAWGSFFVPIDSLGKPPFSAMFTTGSASSICSQLARAKSLGRQIAYSLGRAPTKDQYNQISVSGARAEVLRWKTACPKIVEYITDRTLAFVYVTDEPGCAPCWGWTSTAPALSTETIQRRVDSMALVVKQVLGGVPTVARMKASEFIVPMVSLDAAWSAFTAPRGPVVSFRTREIAAAKSRGLKLVLSLNYLDGGCGLTSGSLCKSVPIAGSGLVGTYPSQAQYQMSGAEITYYGTEFLTAAKADPTVCGFWNWQWSPVWAPSPNVPRPADQIATVQNTDRRADVKAAWDSLGKLARAIPERSCM
jgi:hypothetical protein